jgi:hypothetical protein
MPAPGHPVRSDNQCVRIVGEKVSGTENGLSVTRHLADASPRAPGTLGQSVRQDRRQDHGPCWARVFGHPKGRRPRARPKVSRSRGGRRFGETFGPGEGGAGHARPTLGNAMDGILFHPETSIRRALILPFGTYGTDGLSPGDCEPLAGKLLDLYRNDPARERGFRRSKAVPHTNPKRQRGVWRSTALPDINPKRQRGSWRSTVGVNENASLTRRVGVSSSTGERAQSRPE